MEHYRTVFGCVVAALGYDRKGCAMLKNSTLATIAKWLIFYVILYIFIAMTLFLPFVFIGRILADISNLPYAVLYVGTVGPCLLILNLFLSYYFLRIIYNNNKK